MVGRNLGAPEVEKGSYGGGLIFMNRHMRGGIGHTTLLLQEERQHEIADGDRVAWLQHALRNELVVDDRSVGTSQIPNPPPAKRVGEHLGVSPRDRVVIKPHLKARETT